MATHTPGPWEYDGVRVFAPALDRKVDVVMSDGTTREHGCGMVALPYSCGRIGADGALEHGDHLSNASLIAAAPDLLNAVQSAIDWYGPDGDHISEPVRSQLLAAMAKAEGRMK